MTTLGTLLDRAKEGDADAAVKAAECLRFKVGLDYETILLFVKDRRGIDAARWDELMREGSR